VVVLDGRFLCTQISGFSPPFRPPEGADLTSRVVDVKSGTTVLSLGEQDIGAGVFNPEGVFPEGRYLAVSDDFAKVEIYDLDRRTDQLLTTLDISADVDSDDHNFVLTFDPTGRWLAGGTGNGRIWALDMKQVVAGADVRHALVFNKRAHVGGIVGLAVNGSGTLATASVGDGFVRLWNIPSGELELELRTDPSRGWSKVVFSPDGGTLLYNDGGVLRRYYLETDRLIALAESRLTRGFTHDECRQYLDRARCP
jgi:WD40 repeat protein